MARPHTPPRPRPAAESSTPEAVSAERAFFRDLIPVAGIDSEVALNIVRAGHFLLAEFAANARAHGVSEAQVNALVAVEDHPEGLTMAQIARRMLVSRAGMWGVVRGLEDKGYVRFVPCPDDARALRVYITDAGQALLDAMLPVHLRLVDALVGDCFSKAEKTRLVRLLTRLREHMAARRTQPRARPVPTPSNTRRRG